jgi:hypothetical protein
MSNTRKIAQKIFYTGECDILPTEEEEHELSTKYGMKFPYQNKFNKLVSDFTEEQEEKPAKAGLFDNPFPPVTRAALSKIVDELDDDYNLGVDNIDPKKYKRLESRLDDVKKNAWRKIMLSKIPDITKRELAKGIERAKSIRSLFAYLLLKVSKL